MKKIGIGRDGLALFDLCEHYAIDEQGSVCKVEKVGNKHYFIDLDEPLISALVNVCDKRKEDVLAHIVKLDDLRVDEYTVDIINHRIDGEKFIEQDDDDDFIVILFRGLKMTLFDDGRTKTEVLQKSTKEDMKLLEIIKQAYDYEVSEYYELVPKRKIEVLSFFVEINDEKEMFFEITTSFGHLRLNMDAHSYVSKDNFIPNDVELIEIIDACCSHAKLRL